MMDGIQIIRLHGAQLVPYLEELGALRIRVFADFPYLYEGSIAYEKEYLKVYVNEPQSYVMAILEGSKWVGATTAIPLLAETPAIQHPFQQAGILVNQVCYFGESVLLPFYRGQGYGHLFFDERERFALENGYSITAFCAVVRSDDHPQRPAHYRTNDAFWTKRGYVQRPDLRCTMAWQDKGEQQVTEKELVFWIKTWK